MSDTKKLASPFAFNRNFTSVPGCFGWEGFRLQRLIGPILYALLLFKGCLSADLYCVDYWTSAKGVRAIYSFRVTWT